MSLSDQRLFRRRCFGAGFVLADGAHSALRAVTSCHCRAFGILSAVAFFGAMAGTAFAQGHQDARNGTAQNAPAQNSPAVCMVRAYDSAHLAQHPRQRIARVFVLLPAGAPGLRAPPRFEIRIGFSLRRGGGPYSSLAACETAPGGRAVCALEGDGGDFTLHRAEDGGGLRLRLGRQFIIEGTRDFSPDLADRRFDDHDIRVMRASVAACPRG